MIKQLSVISVLDQLKVKTLIEKPPTFGPLSLQESDQLIAKESVQNLSKRVPLFLVNLEDLHFEKYNSVMDLAREMGIDFGLLTSRLRIRTQFDYNNEKVVLLREEELTCEELINGNLSQERLSDILSSPRIENPYIPPLKYEPKNIKNNPICAVSVLGDILGEYDSVSHSIPDFGISHRGITQRIARSTIFDHLGQQTIIIHKSDISEENLEVKKVSIEQIDNTIFRGKQHTEHRNLKYREKKGWSINRRRADKVALVKHYREQHGETKDFDRKPKIIEKTFYADKITRKFQAGELIDEIIEGMSETLRIIE